VRTYDESAGTVIFALMEALMLQHAADEIDRQHARQLAWQCLRSWTSKLDRSEHAMGNLAFDLGGDAEAYWRRTDMAVLLARLKARETELRRWTGPA
jgi:hypothetical protein